MIAIGFLVFCIVLMFVMDHAPDWVYGAILKVFEKIMD